MSGRLIALAAALGVAALAAVAPSANATDFCNGNGQTVDVGGQAYVAVDSVFWPYLISFWVYAESNGQNGLQRGGESLLFGDADVCQDSLTPDTLIY